MKGKIVYCIQIHEEKCLNFTISYIPHNPHFTTLGSKHKGQLDVGCVVNVIIRLHKIMKHHPDIQGIWSLAGKTHLTGNN